MGFVRSLAFRIALAMSVLLVAAGALIVWQLDTLIHQHEHERYADRLDAARRQLAQAIETDLALSVTGAAVLASDTAIRDAIIADDAVAVLRIASQYRERVGRPLHGAPGLQVYDAGGRIVVRAHDPLHGEQAATPEAVQAVLATGEAIGTVREDEVLGLSLAGIAPVEGTGGRTVGVVEALTAVDGAFIASHEEALGLELFLVSPGDVPAAALTSDLAADGEEVAVEDGRYLATALLVDGHDGEPVAAVYLGVDEDEVHAAVAAIRARTVLGAALGGAATVALAFVVAYLSMRPLRGLVTAARRLQSNDLESRISIPGPREAVELSDALEDLRASLRQTRDAMLSANRELALRFDASTASVREASQELALMHGILAALGGGSAGLSGVADELCELDWVDGAAIALATETGLLSLAASAGLRPAASEALLRVVHGALPGERPEAGVVMALTAAEDDARHLAALAIGGFAAQPMVEPQGITGAVIITTSGALHLTASRAEVLRSVAREVAATLERNELAHEVEENRRIAESVLREMSDGVLVIGPDNACRVVNPAAARLLGRTRAELVGRPAEDCLPLSEDGVAALRRRAASVASTPVAPLLADVRGRRLAISAGPFLDSGTETGGMMVLLRDLSAEAQADRVKQDFVSMVGHELRTPLTLIRTTVDLLHEGDAGGLNETQERIVDVLDANTERLMALINDLLDMSAIDSGRMQIVPEAVELAALVREAVEEAQAAAEAKQHQLLVNTPDNLPAWADRRRVRQVLSNLVGNAIKYTPPGGTIEVVADDAEGWARVDVRDNGIGIPPEEQDQLFEKFYRTTQGRRATGGTGLGLAIARSLVELHGGEIWCASDGETGTTFSFTLPQRPI